MKGNVTCSCGHSWNKSDSSKKDATICHICGKDNTMKDGGWLDQYQEGGEASKYIQNVPKTFGRNVAKIDETKQSPALNYRSVEDSARIEREKELARRQTYLNPASKTSTALAMRQAAEDRIAQEKANAFTRKIAEGAQTIGGALELAAPFTGPFMPIVGGVGAGLGIGSSAYLTGKDAIAGDYGSAALNAGFGALDVAGFAALRNPAVKDFIQGADQVSDYSQVVDLTGVGSSLDDNIFKNSLGINWAKWNKEIPLNKPLMQEYKAIEQTSKANGTWMKNADGSAFAGTPEQFVQQQSSNFKKAFPEGVTSFYRGGKGHIDDFVNKDRNDWALFGSDDIDVAKEYAWHRNDVPGADKPFYNSNTPLGDAGGSGIYELVYPSQTKSVQGNASGRSWRLVDYDPKIAEGTRIPDFAKGHNEDLLYDLENGNHFGLDLSKSYDKTKQYLSTDIYANYVKNINNPETVARINDVVDGGTKSSTVSIVDAMRTPIKSLRGNNGMFDLTNPNIYKSVAPIIGAGAAASQFVDKKKNGGWLDKYNDGGPVQPNYNDYSVSAGPGFEGDGYSNVGRNYSPAWGGQFQMGGAIGGATQGIPGATGFMYARTGTTPSEGKGRNKIYKTDASAQKGRKVPKELTENEIYEKETKEREAAEAASFEKYSREIEKAEAVRVAEELAKSEAFREEESRKRSERDKGRNRIDFDNLKTTQQVNDYLSYMLQENQNKIDKSGVSTIKKNIIDYINSPTYAKRQANFPEQYIGGEAERYQKNKYESTIAKNKREQRISNLSTTPVVIDKKGDVNELNYFDPKLNKVILSEKNMPEVVAHELTHAATQKGERQLIDSDNVNAKYWDSVVAKSKKLPISTRLNRGEMDKFIELAREADESGARDIHADKNTNEVMFTDEQYGDLMGVRSLLYKSGITKSFGEQLDKTKMDKALNDKKIKASPVFKRLLFRYGSDNVINLNNTIAANNPQQGMPMAQDGTQIGPDGIPISHKTKKGYTSVKSTYADKKHDLRKLENDLSDKLDVEKAIDVAQDYIAKNDRGNYWGLHNGPLDAIRHTASSAQTSSQLANFFPSLKYNPAVMLGSVLATNALGLGHELSSPNPWEERASDLYNNLAGSVIGVLPGDETKRNERINSALNSGILSNMKGKNSGDEPFDPRIKSINTKTPKKFIPGKGPLNLKNINRRTELLMENGGSMSYYQNGLDFKPKSISKNGGWLSKYEEGGVIKDDMGQWAHPGEITEIDSNQITMQGVPYPVLGISDTGDTQMMYPDEEYEYDGESVTEYPMMKQGGQLIKLDQLSNFTNYNTKQPGSWLDKYQ